MNEPTEPATSANVAPVPTVPAATHTFYFSPSWAASLQAGTSISRFKGKQFTQMCKIGVAPMSRPDNQSLGNGVLADVTTGK